MAYQAGCTLSQDERMEQCGARGAPVSGVVYRSVPTVDLKGKDGCILIVCSGHLHYTYTYNRIC